MKHVAISSFILFALALFVWALPTAAAPTSCTAVLETSSIPDLTSKEFSFSCGGGETVYFGACDSGGVPNDDYFEVVFQGAVVSSNGYSGGSEFVNVGSAQAAAGNNVATLVSTSTTPFPPATYTIAISQEQSVVSNQLANFCGQDFNAQSGCFRAVSLFTTDEAPAAGTLRMTTQYGEQNRPEGYAVREWQVVAGQQINNESGFVPAPKWVRVWWQPSGSSDWYLLPSQYWANSGTSASEYGVSCDNNGVPSYHTSFELAIPVADVPLFITD